MFMKWNGSPTRVSTVKQRKRKKSNHFLIPQTMVAKKLHHMYHHCWFNILHRVLLTPLHRGTRISITKEKTVKNFLTAKIPTEGKAALGWSHSQMLYCPLRELMTLLLGLQRNPAIRMGKQTPIFPFCQTLKAVRCFWKLAENSQPGIYLKIIK